MVEQEVIVSRRLARVEIDINALTPAGYTRTRMSRASKKLEVGEHVLAFEPEDEIVADAIVADIDSAGDFVYLSVDWPSIRDDTPALLLIRVRNIARRSSNRIDKPFLVGRRFHRRSGVYLDTSRMARPTREFNRKESGERVDLTSTGGQRK